jgi:uncharacterized membrane protein YkoI
LVEAQVIAKIALNFVTSFQSNPRSSNVFRGEYRFQIIPTDAAADNRRLSYTSSKLTRSLCMNMVSKCVRPFVVVSALILGGSIVPAAQAGSIITEPQAIARATNITMKQAETIALNSVGGGKVTLAVLEKENGVIYWSIDITGKTAEYEVWVSKSGKVLKTITQPL